jgi:uncharacterized protein VirK/YbjX
VSKSIAGPAYTDSVRSDNLAKIDANSEGGAALNLYGRLFRKTLSSAFCLVWHLRALKPLLWAARESSLHRLLKARPEILMMGVTPYLAANWDARTRFDRIVDHCITVAAIGGLVDFPPDTIVSLIKLDQIGLQYRISLDQPRWFLRDGQLAISLWDGTDRIFSLQFCLSSREGKVIAYIGGLQGRVQKDHEPCIMDRYRFFTKAAAGMRPRDFLIEIFTMLCQALGVTEICAVSDRNHPQRLLSQDVKLSYDEVWHDRSGHDGGNGFFILPVSARRRSAVEIPGKKRAMYRKRYAMLDAIGAGLAAALKTVKAQPMNFERWNSEGAKSNSIDYSATNRIEFNAGPVIDRTLALLGRGRTHPRRGGKSSGAGTG